MVQKLLQVALLADGHILLEGVPGLAKTLAIKALAKTIHVGFQPHPVHARLLPADHRHADGYSQKNEEFSVKKGPLFSNFILADEINRAPAKVQSALLEAMQERQVTIGQETFHLPEPFPGAGHHEPDEQEGTYPARGSDRPLHVEGGAGSPCRMRRSSSSARTCGPVEWPNPRWW